MSVWWSVVLTVVGGFGFVLAGRKVWWAWYVNIGCQALWAAYAVVTQQWGFIAAAAFYTVVFTRNAVAWTREHLAARRGEQTLVVGEQSGRTLAQIADSEED